MRPLFNVLPCAFVPLFICLPGMSVPLAHFFGYTVTRDSVNLCVGVVLCALGVCLGMVFPTERRLNRLIIVMVAWLTLSLLAGLRTTASTTNVMFYMQTILPLFAIWFGYALIRGDRDVATFIHVSVRTTNVVIICLYAIALLTYGPLQLITDRIQVMYELEYGIPQFKSYYPVCVQFTFSLALAQYLFGEAKHRSSMFRSLLIHAAFVPFCWSRAGLLGFALSAVVIAGFAVAIGNRRMREQAVLITAVMLLLLGGLTLGLGTTVGSREDVRSLDNASDEKRIGLFMEGLQRCLARPVFGDAFVAAWDVREGGVVASSDRLFGAHNQYIDLALRGGFVYLLLFISLLAAGIRAGVSIVRARRNNVPQNYVVLGVAGTSFLLAVAVESNFQLYFIQLLTAVPCMMLIGMLCRIAYVVQSSGARPRAQTRFDVVGRARSRILVPLAPSR